MVRPKMVDKMPLRHPDPNRVASLSPNTSSIFRSSMCPPGPSSSPKLENGLSVGRTNDVASPKQAANRRYLVGHDSIYSHNMKIVAILLIVAGLLGLVYGSFSYTKDKTVVKLGPLELSAKEKQTVNIPVWAGVGAIVVGGLLLALGGKSR